MTAKGKRRQQRECFWEKFLFVCGVRTGRKKTKISSSRGIRKERAVGKVESERTCWHECLGVAASLGPGPRLRLRRAESSDGWGLASVCQG